MREVKLFLLVLIVSLSSIDAFAGGSQTVLNLYRDAALPILGPTLYSAYKWPGASLSASTQMFHADLLKENNALIRKATWYIAWNPNTGPVRTAVRLVSANPNLSSMQEFTHFARTNYSAGDVLDSRDITDDLNQIIQNGAPKIIGHQTLGSGSTSPKIYSSYILIVWN